MRREVKRIVKIGAPVDVDESAIVTRVRGNCGCNSLWQPPNMSLPTCAVCPDGAVNRFAVDLGVYDGLTDADPEWIFAGRQQLVGDPAVACRWASAEVTYEGDPPVDAQWVLDLSVTPPTLTLNVGEHGQIIYEMDAPSFGCNCPTPFRKKCVVKAFDLTTPCEVCVYPPFQYCDDIPIPDTLTCTTSGHINPNANGWVIPLSFTPTADWGPTYGIRRGWAGTYTTGNGVDVYLVFDPCLNQRPAPGFPNGMVRFSGGPCVVTITPPLGTPETQTEVWTPLYSRPSADVYDLQPLEIGLRGTRSQCNDSYPALGLANYCNVSDDTVCDSASFGGATITFIEIWNNFMVTE